MWPLRSSSRPLQHFLLLFCSTEDGALSLTHLRRALHAHGTPPSPQHGGAAAALVCMLTAPRLLRSMGVLHLLLI